MGMHLSLWWLSFENVSWFCERMWETSVSLCLMKPATQCILWNIKSVHRVLSVFLGKIVQISSYLLRKIWLLCRLKLAKESQLLNVKVKSHAGMCGSKTLQCLEKGNKTILFVLWTVEIKKSYFLNYFPLYSDFIFCRYISHLLKKLDLHIFHK